MNWLDTLKSDLNAAALWIAAGIVSIGVWIVRTVLTNKAQVQALEDSIGEIQQNVRLLTKAMLDRRGNEE